MDIKTARRKSFDVEYVIVTEENIEEVAAWCGGTVGGESPEKQFIKIDDQNAMNSRQTKAFLGDHVLKSGTSFKAYSKKAFYKSFDDYVVSGSKLEAAAAILKDTVEHARSSISGQFTTKEDAEANPNTTVVEQIEISQKGPDES